MKRCRAGTRTVVLRSGKVSVCLRRPGFVGGGLLSADALRRLGVQIQAPRLFLEMSPSSPLKNVGHVSNVPVFPPNRTLETCATEYFNGLLGENVEGLSHCGDQRYNTFFAAGQYEVQILSPARM